MRQLLCKRRQRDFVLDKNSTPEQADSDKSHKKREQLANTILPCDENLVAVFFFSVSIRFHPVALFKCFLW